MFQHDSLKTHLETSSSVSTYSKVVAEWNMNIPTNLYQIGNYRYRPSLEKSEKYALPLSGFDPEDTANYYTGATLSDITIDGGFDDQGIPNIFLSKSEKEQQLYSLEDCFGRNRPRSGINKLRWFPNKYSHFVNKDMAQRPRYYPSSREDVFKYWGFLSIKNPHQFEREHSAQVRIRRLGRLSVRHWRYSAVRKSRILRLQDTARPSGYS